MLLLDFIILQLLVSYKNLGHPTFSLHLRSLNQFCITALHLKQLQFGYYLRKRNRSTMTTSNLRKTQFRYLLHFDSLEVRFNLKTTSTYIRTLLVLVAVAGLVLLPREVSPHYSFIRQCNHSDTYQIRADLRNEIDARLLEPICLIWINLECRIWWSSDGRYI